MLLDRILLMEFLKCIPVLLSLISSQILTKLIPISLLILLMELVPEDGSVVAILFSLIFTINISIRIKIGFLILLLLKNYWIRSPILLFSKNGNQWREIVKSGWQNLLSKIRFLIELRWSTNLSSTLIRITVIIGTWFGMLFL